MSNYKDSNKNLQHHTVEAAADIMSKFTNEQITALGELIIDKYGALLAAKLHISLTTAINDRNPDMAGRYDHNGHIFIPRAGSGALTLNYAECLEIVKTFTDAINMPDRDSICEQMYEDALGLEAI